MSKGGEQGGRAEGAAANEAPERKKPRAGPESELEKALANLEGRQYPCYKDLIGEWKGFHGFSVFIDRCQSDPYAPPSNIRARVDMAAAGFPKEYISPAPRNSALCDFLTRAFADVLRGGSGTDWTASVAGGGGWGGSKGGDMQVDCPGQFVLPRTSVMATEAYVEVRLTMALPARGRSIEGHRAAEIMGGGLVEAVQKSLFHSALDQQRLRQHILSVEDQQAARNALKGLGLVAFVANGAVLPRKSGADDRPMTKTDDPNLVAFASPPSLEVELVLPNRGKVKGMGIREGITLIVGGGFHGKSTLLQALQVGVYNKVDGDGREFVVCNDNAVKIRAEDGRSVTATNITPFINNLPFDKDTNAFSTGDASGSTSQAANIIEALEVGATTLLVDEDTCATNFMIRDARMQALVSPDKEPITAFIQKVKPLYTDKKVSTVMVVGGSGDFFEVADTVILMERYAPIDVTEQACQIARDLPNPTKIATRDTVFGATSDRRLLFESGLVADGKVSARNLRCITYGSTEVELTNVEQLVEISQARAIADILQLLGDGKNGVKQCRTFREVVDFIETALWKGGNGLDQLSRFSNPNGAYAMPRRFEIAAAVSRLRTVKMERA